VLAACSGLTRAAESGMRPPCACLQSLVISRAASAGPSACSSGALKRGDVPPLGVSEDRHSPLPNMSLSATALNWLYGKMTHLSTRLAAELRKRKVPGQGGITFPQAVQARFRAPQNNAGRVTG
jgi:hypothetical protein